MRVSVIGTSGMSWNEKATPIARAGGEKRGSVRS